MGLATFTEETRRFFFGRETEIADIFVRVREEPLTVLYGQSGLGKSSLLGAGLIPKLKIEGWRPVLVRLRYEKGDPPLVDQLHAAFAKATGSPPVRVGGAGAAEGGAFPTLWERLHHLTSRPEGIEEHPPVLIFDQFEEIFTLGERVERSGEAAAFFSQLAEVIENRPPTSLRERFEKDRRLARDYDFGPTTLCLVITLREDYLSGLESWKKAIPSLMRNRAALHLLSGPQALEAVVRPGGIDGPPLVNREVGAAIVHFVANAAPGISLEEIGAVPPLLSLVCERLNDARIRDGQAEITGDQVAAQSENILDDFYEESFAAHPLAVRHFVEDELVTERGHRAPFSREDAVDMLRREGVEDPAAALDDLLVRRIITAEERGGIPWIEITHDVLAPLVVRSRDERQERERADAEQKRAESIEKERRRLRKIASVFAMLAVLAVAGMVFGWLKTREAAKERDLSRHNEGLALLLRAQVAVERGNLYPDTLLYAAKAIGFDGVGRPAGDLPDSLKLIREDYRDGKDYRAARDWIASRPAYRPLWSTELREAEPATALAAHPSGRWLALGSREGVRLFDLEDEGRETTLPELAGVTDLAFSPDGETLMIVAGGGVRSWLMEEARYGESPDGMADALAWSPGGDWLAGAGDDGSVLLWREGLGEAAVIPGDGAGREAVISLTFSPEDAFLAGIRPGLGPRTWFPDYGAAASAWTKLETDEETLETLDKRERLELSERAGVAATTTCVAVSPDGMVLATGTSESETGSFDGESREIVRGGIVLWDAGGAEIVGRVSPELRHGALNERNIQGAVRSVAYRADGRQLASGAEDGTIKLWEVSGVSLRLVATLTGHSGVVTRLFYSRSGEILASAGGDGSAKLWDVSGRNAAELDLYSYQGVDWYRFTPEVEWQSGTGFLNEAALARATYWGPEASDSVAALVADAEKAVEKGRWREVELRARELERLGTALPEELAAAIAAALPPSAPAPQATFVNGEGMALIWCPPTGPEGFRMGSPEGEEGRRTNETPHQVILTQGFWLGKYEVTQADWLEVMGDNPSTQKAAGLTLPVETVSWDMAVEFCERLTDRERARGTIRPDWEYRLPTEAQWEYACRAGTETAYSFGDDPAELHRHGNYSEISGNFVGGARDHDDGHQYSAPVGSYPENPNPWGFYDLHGNVFEWCLDAFVSYGDDTRTDPYTERGPNRVSRGGGFSNTAADCRSANRDAGRPASRSDTLGLRPALVPSMPVSPSEPEADPAGGRGGERSE